jgi:hypothetical protein
MSEQITVHGYRLNKCACGGKPRFRVERSGEDCEDTWVECSNCDLCGDYSEDAYADYGTAAMCWNRGQFDTERTEYARDARRYRP